MSPDLFRLDGKAIVVAGGAGHIGSKVCEGLSTFGARVLCVSSQKADIGAFVSYAICDVRNEAAFGNVVQRFADRCGRLDGLVNAAGRAPRGLDPQMPADAIVDALRQSLVHHMTCAGSVLANMKGPGSIVSIASMWGLVAPTREIYPADLNNEPGLPVPCAAAGVMQLMKTLAMMGGPRGIRANAVVPGWFPKKRGPDRPDYMEAITSRVCLGRIGQADELVGAVVFLLSDASSYMTGQSLVIDGGYTIR